MTSKSEIFRLGVQKRTQGPVHTRNGEERDKAKDLEEGIQHAINEYKKDNKKDSPTQD